MIDGSNGPGHMTSMAAMPIYGKNLKNLLWNQKADDLKSWYAASGTGVLQNLFKWWPWVDLDLFYSNTHFVPFAFVWEKGKTMDFLETIVVCDHKVNRGSQLNEYMKLCEYQKSRSFINLGTDLSDSIFFYFVSSITTWLFEAKFHMEPSKDGGMKAYSNGTGHLTKMAPVPIYGKNL